MKSKEDLELLGEFARDQSQDAFTALVQRHLNLVYCAALRQARSPQLAEEVAQSVFTDLARNAGRLKPSTVLTAWLYEVTRRTAINVVRGEARRQLREQTAVEMNAMNANAAEWTQIESLLDEAMHALDKSDRAAVLLRFFENKSLREVGQILGTTDDTARKRVNRAIEHLRRFFGKRGITVGASALVIAISGNAVQAAPSGMAVTISTAASLGGTTIASILTATATKAIAMTITQKVLITTALVAIPVTILWRANSSLKQELRESRLASSAPSVQRTSPQPPTVARTKQGTSIKASAKAPPAGAMEASDLTAMLEASRLTTMREEMKRKTSQEVNRLSLRLKLTPEQKQQLQQFLEEINRVGIEAEKGLSESGAWTRENKDEWTPEDRKYEADIYAMYYPEAKTAPFMESLLTPGQQQEYAVLKEEKRIADAEEHAHAALTAIGKKVDLTADQKDRLFQALAQKKLTARPGVMLQFDESSDNTLRAILTAEQFQAYEKGRQEDERAAREGIKMEAPVTPAKKK